MRDLGLASFSVSRTGVLVYREGELTGTRLVWLDRSGKETPLLDEVADYRDTAFSPDGTRLAYDMSDSVNSTRGDVWIRDMARGVSSRFTFDAAAEINPIWSPDGRRIAYTSRAQSPGDLIYQGRLGHARGGTAARHRRRGTGHLRLVSRRQVRPLRRPG